MKRPPALLSRPTYEWISRIDEKHKQLAALRLSAEQKASLNRQLEIAFAHSTLGLESVEVSPSQIAHFASSTSIDAENLSGVDLTIAETIEALRIVRELAQSKGRAASLTPELLLKLRGPFASETSEFLNLSGYNRQSPAPSHSVRASVESACLWFTADSFMELNPAEQAAIVHLRLVEMRPFEQTCDRIALIAASLFTLRGDLPAIIIEPQRFEAYKAALNEAARMNTRPMVELIVESLDRTLAEMIDSIEKNR